MTSKNERIIGEFVARRTGNSLTLTVPKSAGVTEGSKFVLSVKDDGTLEYRQTHHNPWLDGDYNDIDFKKELNDTGNYGMEKPIGKERLD